MRIHSWKKIIASASVFLAMAAGSRPVFAQSAMAFQQAFAYAKSHNLEIAALNKQVAAAESDVAQAGLIPNPTLALSQTSAPFPQFVEGEQSIVASQELELGGKRKARLAAARRALDVARLRQADALRKLRLQVRSGFFRAWGADEKVKVLNEMWKSEEKFLLLSEQGYKEGEFAGTEIDLLKSEALRIEQKLDFARGEAQATRADLAPLLGMTPNQIPPLDPGKQAFPFIPNLDTLLVQAENRPDLKEQDAAVREAQSKIALEKSLGIPNLTVGAGYVKDKLQISGDEVSPANAFSSIHQDEGEFRAVVSIPLPIFNRNQGNIAKAKDLYESADLEEKQLRKKIQSEVASSWAKVTSEKKIEDRYVDELLPAVKANRDRIEKGYLLGGESILAVIMAERTYLQSESDRLDNLQALYQSIASLESSVGGEWP